MIETAKARFTRMFRPVMIAGFPRFMAMQDSTTIEKTSMVDEHRFCNSIKVSTTFLGD